MELADVVAWVMLAVLMGWLGIVLYATFAQLDGERRRAAEQGPDERN